MMRLTCIKLLEWQHIRVVHENIHIQYNIN